MIAEAVGEILKLLHRQSTFVDDEDVSGGECSHIWRHNIRNQEEVFVTDRCDSRRNDCARNNIGVNFALLDKELVLDAFVEVLTNSALYGGTNIIMSIFLSKAIYKLRDNTTLEIVNTSASDNDYSTPEQIARKYNTLPAD